RAESVTSAEGAPPKHQTSLTTPYYYDSGVQDFFKELDAFVSECGFLMRKAEYAARLERLVEQELVTGSLPSHVLPRLSGTPRMQVANIGGQAPKEQGSCAYDDLNKELAGVQSISERAAENLLRRGECREEIGGLQSKLAETKHLAEQLKRMHIEP
ncbi:hypothetical protein QBC46DRAFT_274457, partial [Diplogelasinospora grovesii]